MQRGVLITWIELITLSPDPEWNKFVRFTLWYILWDSIAYMPPEEFAHKSLLFETSIYFMWHLLTGATVLWRHERDKSLTEKERLEKIESE